MAKAVLISIRPEWCEKILRGEKTIEVRKNRPKLQPPFKCYIYCTKPKHEYEDYIVLDYPLPRFFGGGKVVGEFICYDFVPFSGGKKKPGFGETRAKVAETNEVLRKACLGARELWEYAPKGDPIGWCIGGALAYDEPRELSGFRRVCPNELDCESCAMHSENAGRCGNEALALRRAPQSWCYVEEG